MNETLLLQAAAHPQAGDIHGPIGDDHRPRCGMAKAGHWIAPKFDCPFCVALVKADKLPRTQRANVKAAIVAAALIAEAQPR